MNPLTFNISDFESTRVPTFREISELIHFALLDLGCDSVISSNHICSNKINILFGIHHFGSDVYKDLPPETTIIINTEPLQQYAHCTDHRQTWLQRILAAASRYKLWDYSQENLSFFAEHGITHGKYLQLGYHEKLHRITQKQPEIDVLFYGSMNERRAHILYNLQAHGLRVKHLFNVWHEERDEWISKSQIVLNLHFEDLHPFEIVRCFYLMNNGIAVVSEESEHFPIDEKYRTGVVSAPYDKLVETCVALCKQPETLAAQRQLALQTIQRYAQAHIIQQLLYDTFVNKAA